jgi:ketosteroid isomerase-like protein
MTQSNAEILRGGYEAFTRGDVPAVLALFAEDITWHVPGRNPTAGDYSGHDEVVGFFQTLGELSGGTFNIEVRDVLDNGGDTVAMIVTERGERNGVKLEVPAVHVWHMQDGMATSFRGFAGDQYHDDEFWS